MSSIQYEGEFSGKTLHLLFRDAGNTVVDLVAGTGERVALYSVTEAQLAAASLPAGTYAPIVLTGAAASHDITVDAFDGHISTFVFDGTVITGSDGGLVTHINGIRVSGVGTEASPWGPV